MTFDFRKIKSDCPKAFTLLKEWIHKENSPAEYRYDVANYISPEFHIFNNGNIGIGHEMDAMIFNPLELDFFFDEQRIYGSVFGAKQHWQFKIFASDEIIDSMGLEIGHFGIFPSRSEALASLWLKEFETLESKL